MSLNNQVRELREALEAILDAMKEAQQANSEAYSEFLCEIAEEVPSALMKARAALARIGRNEAEQEVMEMK